MKDNLSMEVKAVFVRMLISAVKLEVWTRESEDDSLLESEPRVHFFTLCGGFHPQRMLLDLNICWMNWQKGWFPDD